MPEVKAIELEIKPGKSGSAYLNLTLELIKELLIFNAPMYALVVFCWC